MNTPNKSSDETIKRLRRQLRDQERQHQASLERMGEQLVHARQSILLVSENSEVLTKRAAAALRALQESRSELQEARLQQGTLLKLIGEAQARTASGTVENTRDIDLLWDASILPFD